MSSSVFSFLPIAFIIGAFYFIVKRKRAQQAKKINRKDDIWYVIKEYLKLTGRQGHKLADLSLYPRAQTISTLREYIAEVKRTLKIENARLVGIRLSHKKLKREEKLEKLIHLGQKNIISYFPKEEKYQKIIELKTLRILARKYSAYREYLDIYRKEYKTDKFKQLIKKKLIGEALSKTTDQKGKIIPRNRYLVCFRTIDKNKLLTPWEAIEIELFKNPKRNAKEKYKILFTSSLNYREELHWIYAMQIKYFKDKRNAAEQIALDKESAERKRRIRLTIMKFLLPLLTLLRLKKISKKN